MSVQYTIPFTVQPDFSAQALIPHAGVQAAQAWLDGTMIWPTNTLVLSGPAACGKSHLAALTSLTIRVWDLVQRPLKTRDTANALFHLINECQAHQRPLLILSRVHPNHIYPDLPDLDSRLRAASHVQIEDPKEETIRHAILFKMATDHQLRLDLDTAAYISTRLPQTLEALWTFCARAAQSNFKAELSKIAARPLIEQIEAELG